MQEQMYYNGEVSKLFDALKKGDQEAIRHLTIVEDYGSHHTTADGQELPLFQWEDGGRKLARYEEDRTLFLVQTSVVYEEEDSSEDRDWFQVASREQAEWLNEHLDGHKLAYEYKAPHAWSAEGKILFSLASDAQSRH